MRTMSDKPSEPGQRAADIVDLFAGKKAGGKSEGVHHLMGVLARNDRGGTLPTLANALLIMAHDPPLKGMLAYNEFRHESLIMRAPPPAEDGGDELPGPYPRPWASEDASLVQAYLQRVWASKFSRETTDAAMVTTAHGRRFHPVRDWLAGLVWDGKPRVDAWLTTACGVMPSDYHAAIGAKFLIAAVRRVRQPGVKFDCMLLLEGNQGIGKSKLLQALFGNAWFSDDMPANLSDKDAAMALLGIWCFELAEIEHLIRTEVEVIKAFLSRGTDRYRVPYGRAYIERPRQGVLVGTTNSRDYLRDATGNRRIWPAWCEFADDAWVTENREQLWAEAAAREAAGETLWLDDSEVNREATTAQAERMQDDVWSEPIMTWMAGRVETNVGAVLSEALLIPKAQQDRRAQLRVAGVLKSAGWESCVVWEAGRSVRRWRAKS